MPPEASQAGGSFAFGGHLFQAADRSAGYTAERLEGQFLPASIDPTCAAVVLPPEELIRP